MELYLRSKTWVEKVHSIERMNAFSKRARAAMAETLKKEAHKTSSDTDSKGGAL